MAKKEKRDREQEIKDTLNMTSGQVAGDLLKALVQEIRLLPEPWVKMPKAKQDDVIERLRMRVEDMVRMAVHLIASEGRAVADATLEQVTFKNGIKAVFNLSKSCPARHDLADSEGKLCLIVVADAGQHMGGLDDVKGESDQRAMDLGHEYDPKGDGKGMDGNVVDADVKALPDAPLQSDLDDAYNEGWAAAEAGKPKTDCPITRHEIVQSWTQGWTDWHEGDKPAREDHDGNSDQGHDEDQPADEPA